MLKLGYVKIILGKDKGRIGRLVGYDERTVKVKVAFGYENDIIPYFNYKYYSARSLSNEITKQDLADRYFQISQHLKSIDLRAHSQVKKNSESHISLISEYNIVRLLLHEYFHYESLHEREREKNIILLSSFLDILWVNELALDLEVKGFHVAIVDHEICQNEGLNNKLKQYADHYIFIESQHDYEKDRYEEYSYFHDNLSDFQTLSVIVTDKNKVDEEKGFYFFGDVFSEAYERGLRLLSSAIDDPAF